MRVARVARAARVALFVVCAVGSSTSCIAVQTHTTADLVVETTRGHDHYVYESWDSHNISPIAIACLLTATFYGGACWAYLATPFDEHEINSIEAAKREVAALGGCAHIVSARVEGVGWDLKRCASRYATLRGRALSTDDVARLCTNMSPVVIEGPAPAVVDEPKPVRVEPKPIPVTVTPKPRVYPDPVDSAPADPADP